MSTTHAGPRTDLEMDHFVEILEAERERLTIDLQRLDRNEESGGTSGEISDLADYDQHPADQGTETFMREQDLAIHDSLNAELRQVEAAFHRIENGTFGYCERCGTEIPEERLEVLPFAAFCMKCADDLEGRV